MGGTAMKRKVLIVEDNKTNLAILNEILSSEYRVIQAENGQEALDVLAKEKGEISLILLDIVMPVMDGYTFLSIVKAEPSYELIPVIVATQSDSEEDEVEALSHGAADFVTKPYRPQIILQRIANLIKLRETAAMVNQVQYDRLTGLYSKEFFYQRIRETLIQNPNKVYDIVCSDIENFKLINDVFGTAAGDRMLCGIADFYISTTAGAAICGRLGADQFGCFIESRAPYTKGYFVNALNTVRELTNAKNVIMKWGIYSVEERSLSVEKMCDRALLAAQSIKGQYGKIFAVYDDELRGKLLREQAITDEMDDALAAGQFEIYFQPQYRISDESLSGAEALVRWNHPKWGLQLPARFIPLFEKNGFITQLDRFVWQKVCSTIKEWDRKGYLPIPVSVNVSRADIYNADLVDILLETIKSYGVDSSRIPLEITESAYTENPSQIIETVELLKTHGFVIEMDDFGSGYSSLNMLNQMPLDNLKLDMQFIRSETAKPLERGIMHFIMEFARSMDLRVVAEGVETPAQLERLRAVGCNYAQGYYFARPMPCESFEKLLATQTKCSTH